MGMGEIDQARYTIRPCTEPGVRLEQKKWAAIHDKIN